MKHHLRFWKTTVTGIVAAATALVALPTASASAQTDDWLAIVNTYRAMSGLAPVSPNGTWSAEAAAHSCYMLYNGISHDEIPGRLGYTPGGDVAGNSGNVSVSSAATASARSHIDLWMTGPFHAIGVLRHNLSVTGFGMCANADTSPWRSGATLDVLRGIDRSRPRPSTPIVFPGNGTTTPLSRFVAESPNPVALCGWTGGAGLPLIAMMPSGVSWANASLVGPGGPVETCVLHPGNTNDSTARAILSGENAVVVVPRVALQTGTYTATVSSSGGSTTWSFNVDPAAGLVPPPLDVPETAPASVTGGFDPVVPHRYADSRAAHRLLRLRANVPSVLVVADPETAAVSANFTVDRPSAPGYLTAYDCSASVPQVSTLNFSSLPVANQAIIPLSAGRICLIASTDTDVIVDVNGFVRPAGADRFEAVTPGRVYDTRGWGRFAEGEVRRIQLAGLGGAPVGSSAVAVNLTATNPLQHGFVSMYPCEVPSDVSTVNFRPGETRPNSAIVRTSADGTVCVRTSVSVDVIVDVTGWFGAGASGRFTALSSIRLLDTRQVARELNPVTGGAKVEPGQTVRLPIAGVRGVPAGATAVSVNLTAVDHDVPGYVTAFPCGALPQASNVNTTPYERAVANGAQVALSPDGALCLYSDHRVHLIVDINGIWS
ncbi:MAG: CAP domain-containing protein [Ilumatobacteraceae bacterium]|nr:CAP domain-containing protein [Ilumatobacteraceae bacterium]